MNWNINYVANDCFTNLPTKFSKTLLLPALWLPTTAIWGKSIVAVWPVCAKASISLFIIGMRSCIPLLPAILTIENQLTIQWNWPPETKIVLLPFCTSLRLFSRQKLQSLVRMIKSVVWSTELIGQLDYNIHRKLCNFQIGNFFKDLKRSL